MRRRVKWSKAKHQSIQTDQDRKEEDDDDNGNDDDDDDEEEEEEGVKWSIAN